MNRKHKTLKAYAIAGVILTSGCMVSLSQNDWSWFSRCGSLVVIIGIILTSSQIFEHIQIMKLRQLNLSSALNRDWAQEDRQQTLHESRFNEDIAWTNERSGLLMLITGTLIWGFGDLIEKLL
jgi:ABC-type phosphate transport system permease subunit